MRNANERIEAHANKIRLAMDYDSKRLRVATELMAAIISKRHNVSTMEVGEEEFCKELTRVAKGAISGADALLKELGYVKP